MLHHFIHPQVVVRAIELNLLTEAQAFQFTSQIELPGTRAAIYITWLGTGPLASEHPGDLYALVLEACQQLTKASSATMWWMTQQYAMIIEALLKYPDSRLVQPFITYVLDIVPDPATASD